MRLQAAALLCLCPGTAAALAAPENPAPAQAAIGALDFLFIFLAAYVVWRVIAALMRQRRGGDDSKTYDVTPEHRRNEPGEGENDGRDTRSRRAQAAWEYLTGEKGPDLHPDAESTPDEPGTFNEREFLRGAKIIYSRIRQSWAGRDLADLRQFAAPEMMTLFEKWAEERPDRDEVAVLLVEAKVADLKRDGKRTEVRVAYDATLSDDPKTKEPKKISEIWTFSRDETLADANWLLESMESVS